MSLHSSSSSGRTAGETVQLAQLAASHHGWLYRRSIGSLLRGWRRRFFVLSDERLYVFKDCSPAAYPLHVVDLTAFRSVQQVGAPRRTKYGFELRTARRPSVFDRHSATDMPPPPGELELYAESEGELHQWIGAISTVFVSMDLRAFQSPLSNFDALVMRAGKLGAPGGSILDRLDRHRAATSVDRLPSESTLASTGLALAQVSVTAPLVADSLWQL